jgi:hypothetical protein
LIFIFLGLIIGGVLGESLGLVLGQIGELEFVNAGFDNLVRNLFVTPFEIELGIHDGTGMLIDLYLVKFRLGFAIKFNLCSIAGMIFSLYIMKWSGRR